MILIAWIIALVLYLVLRKSHVLTFDMVLYKHKSQWWVLTGECESPIDRHLDINSA
jgi:hypothetical protein